MEPFFGGSSGSTDILCIDLDGDSAVDVLNAEQYADRIRVTLSRCGACNPCDANCDGMVNAFDIEPFLMLLFDPNPQPCNTCTGDANGDGSIDAFDIEPFLECLFP